MTSICKLDASSIPASGVCVFAGRSGSGKTLLMRDIMSHKCRQFKKCIVMSGSATSAQDFAQHVPSSFVFDGFHEDILEKVVSKQDRDQKMGKCKPLLIVLDDLAYLAQHIKHCDVVKRIFFNGRHYKIFLLLSMQYVKLFPPEFRSNINFVFCTMEKNPANRRLVFEAFNNIFHDFDSFDRAFCALTSDYKCMVLDNVSNKSMAIADNVFWYKAAFPAAKWTMNPGGSMWRYHLTHYDPRYFLKAEADESQETTGGKKKKKQPSSYTASMRKKRV